MESQLSRLSLPGGIQDKGGPGRAGTSAAGGRVRGGAEEEEQYEGGEVGMASRRQVEFETRVQTGAVAVGLRFESGEQWWRQREKGRDVGLGRGEEPGRGGGEGRPGGRKPQEWDKRSECGAGGQSEAGQVPLCWTAADPGARSASWVGLGFVVEKPDFQSGLGVKKTLLVPQLRAQRPGSGPQVEEFDFGKLEMPSEGLQILVKNLWLEVEQVEPPGLQLKDELGRRRRVESESGGEK